MKVWVVAIRNKSKTTVNGVFSTREKSLEYVKKIISEGLWVEIHRYEMEIDNPEFRPALPVYQQVSP